MTTRGPAIKPGDVITWLGEPSYWEVIEDHGLTLLIERTVTDSRGNTWDDRRQVPRRACRLVGSQIGLELPWFGEGEDARLD